MHSPTHILRTAGLGLAAAGLLTPGAVADVEAWQAVDVTLPLTRTSALMPEALKAFTIAQEAPRFEGLGVLRFSVGPRWRLNPQLSLGLYGDLIALQAPAGHPTQELRLNLEPTYTGRWSDQLGWIERVRAEYRQLPTAQSLRLRNLLRLNWWIDPDHLAFVSDEVFYEFPGGLNQNRLMLGLGHPLTAQTRLEFGYLARWRATGSGGEWDHVLTLFVFFAPAAEVRESKEAPHAQNAADGPVADRL